MSEQAKDRLALVLYLAAILAGALLRFLELTTRPLHHDEGVNALFLLDLIREGRYKYDPANYHGPLLYYTVAPLLLALGEKTAVLRLAPAAIGTATLALFWPLRRAIGRWGMVAGAWLLAFSPPTVYFNRDLIHETWFVASAALVVGAAAAYAAERRPLYVLLAWVGIAAFVATKETAPLLLGALVAGAVVAGCLTRGRGAAQVVVADLRRSASVHLWGILLALALLALFYTSFTRNPGGFLDMFKAYMFWAKTGTHGAGHEKPWAYFFGILWRYERVAYVLGLLGLVVALLRKEAAAAFGVASVLFLGAHASIPYKTPWLVIGVVPWLAASAGYLVDRAIASARPPLLALLVAVVFAATLAPLGMDAHRLSLTDFDDDRESIVYSQTTREFLDFVVALRAAVLHAEGGLNTPVDVMSQDHFPINWYARDFTQLGYWGDAVDPRAGSVVVVSGPNREGFRGRITGEYRVKTFALRPGVDLTLAIPAALFERAKADITAPGRWSRLGPINLPAELTEPARPGTLAPGLVAATFPGARFEERPSSVIAGRPPHVDYDGDENHEWQPPFGIEWTGYLDVREEGVYRFDVTSDDGARLDLDGQTIVDDWGRHAAQRKSGSARLGAGHHAVRITYVDHGGGAKLSLTWVPPAGSEQYLPADRLFHDAAQLEAARRPTTAP